MPVQSTAAHAVDPGDPIRKVPGSHVGHVAGRADRVLAVLPEKSLDLLQGEPVQHAPPLLEVTCVPTLIGLEAPLDPAQGPLEDGRIVGQEIRDSRREGMSIPDPNGRVPAAPLGSSLRLRFPEVVATMA